MPDRPHRDDELDRPAQGPDRVRPSAGLEQPADLPRRAEPGKPAEAGHAASRRPDTGGAEWWKPFEQGRPRGPVKPWELARERYRTAENKPPPGSLADMKAQLEMLPPLDPSSPWNPDGTRRPKPPNPRNYELPLPSEAGRGPEGTTPSWLDLLPSGDRVLLPRPRRTERHPHGPAEAGRPPAGHPGTPTEVTHNDPPTPEPLTDAEYAEHLAHVKKSLEQAHANGLATDDRFTLNPDKTMWRRERRQAHDALIEELYSQASHVPNDRKAIMLGGLCGAGKTTVSEKYAGIDLTNDYVTVSADDIKEFMAERGMIPSVEGLSPMEASDLAHEESSHIARQLARRAIADGKNIVLDITMSSPKSVDRKIDDLRGSAYTIKGIFVDIPIATSMRRAEERYWKGQEKYHIGEGNGGRYLPPEVISKSSEPHWGSVNRRTFEQVKHRFDTWSLFDNSVDGRKPRLVDSSGEEKREAPNG